MTVSDTQIGDWVLKMIASTISSAKRDLDIIARIGGEEFVLLLPETNVTAALVVAERIRQNVQANSLAIGKDSLTVTISVGVAEATVRTAGVEHVLRNADQAMYQSKRNGRNRVTVFHPPVDVVAAAAE